MCDFLEWMLDEDSGFRKLIIKTFCVTFISELDKFRDWDGDFKVCNKCNNKYPRVSYFFKLHPSNKEDNLHNTCKECLGSRFKWGSNKQKELLNLNHHYCVKCDTILPMNEIYFPKNKNRPSGFGVTCKQCGTFSSSYGIPRFLNEIANVQENMQVCLGCFIELPKNQDYYFRTKKDSDEYETKCKKCQDCEYGIIKWNSVVSVPNMRVCTGCREILTIDNFYIKDETNGLRYSRCNKCHYISRQNRIHQQSNSQYTLDDWNYAINFFKNENGKQCCAYCGIETDQLEKEHILPFSKGGELSRANIIPSCKSCNCSKCDKTLDEFFVYKNSFTEALFNKVSEYMRLFKTVE